jgi:hypothetical protein
MTLPDPILKSDSLDALLKQKADITARTVPIAASVKRKSLLLTIGTTDNEAAKDKDTEIQRTLKGETIDCSDIRSELAAEQKQWRALVDAGEYLDGQIRLEKDKLATEYCKTLKPKHDAAMARLLGHLVDAHVVHSELSEIRRHLIDSGILLRNICLMMPAVDAVLGNSKAAHSDLGNLFRAAKSEGIISKVPAEYMF